MTTKNHRALLATYLSINALTVDAMGKGEVLEAFADSLDSNELVTLTAEERGGYFIQWEEHGTVWTSLDRVGLVLELVQALPNSDVVDVRRGAGEREGSWVITRKTPTLFIALDETYQERIPIFRRLVRVLSSIFAASLDEVFNTLFGGNVTGMYRPSITLRCGDKTEDLYVPGSMWTADQDEEERKENERRA